MNLRIYKFTRNIPITFRHDGLFNYLFIGAMLLFAFTSCKKGYLEVKSSKSLIVPQTIKDFQAMLDVTSTMNYSAPIIGEISSDDYYVSYDDWQAVSDIERGLYIWEKKLTPGEGSDADWVFPYRSILMANIALDGLEKIRPAENEQNAWNNVKGSALFYRAYNFYTLIQIYGRAYDPVTATTDPGIVIKTSPDVQEKYNRSSVQQTYDQIVSDLNAAKDLLPVKPLYKTRPSKSAVEALLARTYLIMGDYDKAFEHANIALNLYPTLIDYNTLDISSPRPIKKFNEEVIFDYKMIGYLIAVSPIPVTDPVLFQSYTENDLRRLVCYNSQNGAARFKGFYSGDILNFAGIASDELYLIRAECAARKGNKDGALSDLNTLLQSRWKAGTFVPFSTASAPEALDLILQERRKELPFRGLRWSDLKRLNKDPRYSRTLERILNGQTYMLPPNDSRYVLPIPANEVAISGIQQNIR